jgi:hypothetical protein
MHLYTGSPGLRAQGDRAAGEAALILAYPVHPICPIAGSFSPDPELRRQGQTHREDRRRIEPPAPVRRAAPVRAALQQIDRAAREGRVDSPARAQAICRTGERCPSGRVPAGQVLRIVCGGNRIRPHAPVRRRILARGRAGFRTEPLAPVRRQFRLAGRGWPWSVGQQG